MTSPPVRRFTARERLIEKLSDAMDPDNAASFVDEVIADARRHDLTALETFKAWLEHLQSRYQLAGHYTPCNVEEVKNKLSELGL